MNPSWMQQANCAGLPNDVFFSDDPGDQDSAIRICNRCVVKAECLAYAFECDESMREGVWGGTTGQERADYAADKSIKPGRIADRILRPNSRRAWDLPDSLQGNEHTDRDELVRTVRRSKEQ